jgi:hypothetical protein
MSDRYHEDDQAVVLNPANNAVVANSIAPKPGQSVAEGNDLGSVDRAIRLSR